VPVRVRLSEALQAHLPRSGEEAARALAGLEPAVLLAESRTTRTAIVVVPGFGRLVRKEWHWPTAADRVRGAFRTTLAAPSPAEREARALERLQSLPSGAFGPKPLGTVEERHGAVLIRCTLFAVEIAETLDLARWLGRETDARARRHTLEDLGRRLAEMHAAGLLDREFHPRNVLVVAESGRTYKVDCPKARVRRPPLAPSQAAVDLAALDVGLVRLATARERLRFLRSYLGGARPRSEERALCARVERVRRQIDARESRRLP